MEDLGAPSRGTRNPLCGFGGKAPTIPAMMLTYRTSFRAPALATLAAVAACGDLGPSFVGRGPITLECSIPLADVHRGAIRGAIPALVDPTIGFFGEPGIEYLEDEMRVVGLMLDGVPVAVPHPILWWHEIVNFETEDGAIAVTHCPLTGSTLAFDRGAVDDAAFEVSGLLYQNNLMMVDLSDEQESFWPQMARGARCGPRDRQALPMVPVVETTWKAWRAMNPTTRAVSRFTGHSADYDIYPYGDYDREDNPTTLFPISTLDERRPAKELALGIPDGDGGTVFPLGELAEVGAKAVIPGLDSGGEYVVFYDDAARGAMAYRPRAGGGALTFRYLDRAIVDDQTGSTWEVDGHAVTGPLQGQRLEPVAEAFVAFWFAWPLFYPDVRVWEAP